MKDISIAIILPVHNKLSYTKNCLEILSEKIFESVLVNQYSLIVVDDGSTDGTYQFIKNSYPKVYVLKGDGNLWWSGAVNMGVQYVYQNTNSDYILLWNNDIQVCSDYFSILVDKAKYHLKDEIIIGSKIYMDDKRTIVWSMGGKFKKSTGFIYMIGYNQLDRPEFKNNVEVEWLPGMGSLIPLSIIKKIGFWDAVNFPQYHGDLEFTYRAWMSGYRIIVYSDLILINDVTNSGLKHNGSYIQLNRMLHDKRSLYNYKINLRFISEYGSGVFKYYNLFVSYLVLMLSFIKAFVIKKIR